MLEPEYASDQMVWWFWSTRSGRPIFGELALLDDGLHTASVIASEPTRCLIFTCCDFLKALRASDAIVILEELVKRFRRTFDSL